MIPSTEVVRAFYAPSSNIATSLLAGADPFAGMMQTSVGNTLKLNISPYADPLVPSLEHPEFDAFVTEINGLLNRRVISQADLRYLPFPYDAQRVYAVCECRDRWGRGIFLLEPGSEGSKTASTLIAPSQNGSMPEDFIQILLDNNGSWNRNEPLMQRAELVRHCRYRVAALEKHIQALRR